MIKITKIKLNNFRFFADDEQNNSFNLEDGKNLLLYGENGSGKSSLFKAFDFLTKTKIDEDEFQNERNIFKLEEESFIEFNFNNSDTLRIDGDHLELNDDYPYINKLSVFKPILDYKTLLNIHYNSNNKTSVINIYPMLKELLNNYPITHESAQIMSDLNNPQEYFETMKSLVTDEFFEDIKTYLTIFDNKFNIDSFDFDMQFSDDGRVEFITTLKINYMDNELSKYHLFLNEARLTSLAISVYFTIIKNIATIMGEDSLKILVLDDLLISLDMSNRLHLVDLLKTHFTDFQIIFLTHDKALFEIFKEKMEWKPYEIYVDENEEGVEIPYIKTSNSLLQQAINHKINKNYDCSANLLRQYCEKLLCKLLPTENLVNKNCKTLDLNGLLQNGISFENGKGTDKNQITIEILTELQTFRRVLLNPASHNDDTNIFKREIEDTINLLNDFKNELEIIT